MVKKININYDKLYELTHPVNYYDKGISSHIFCYDKDTLVKFDKNLLGPADRMTSDKIASYMDYRDRFGKRNQLFACNIVAQQDTLSRLQDKVILTSFPKGVVFYEGLPVGLLIKKFDDYEKIKANNLSYTEMYHIFDKIVNAQEELMDNNIYNVEGAFAEKALFNKGNGDVQFKKKSYARMKELISAEHRTVLIVSHNESTLKELCDEVIWLHDGKIRDMGKPDKIIEKYTKFMENPKK